MDDGAKVSFEQDVKPLFLQFDRDQMLFAFDLWRVADVRENAEMILDRLVAGDMPCDRQWPEAQITLFEAWMKAGCPD
ncbi:hypothetical protein [Acuticoccus mangrovi]|uniref:Uncharacterized protein n=1 Tax=Acuticoccus mangrovi TaxID=2796142 RepID=A0A934IIH9_9HYPH|nr:hypothetical protein [Acuticoccus mangrovi]MBJ3775621.1 hypothetical protein [Acuticoccus mangrovi]